MKYMFGCENDVNVIELIEGKCFIDICWCDDIFFGKFDFMWIVDFCNMFIILYLDVVLLVVIWYEKYDLLSIDMYFYVYFFNLVVDLLWEVCIDFEVFWILVYFVFQMVVKYLGICIDIVVVLLMYDIFDEMMMFVGFVSCE